MELITLALLTTIGTALLRLLINPRVSIGLFLLSIGLGIKLIANPKAGVTAAAFVAVGIVVLLLLARNADLLVRAFRKLDKTASKPFVFVIEQLTEIPLFVVTLIVYTTPVLAQVYGSLSLYNFLLKLNTFLHSTPAKAYMYGKKGEVVVIDEEEVFLPSIIPSVIITIVYLGWWMLSKTGKVPNQTPQLMMQTSWVISSLFSATGRTDVIHAAFTVALPSLCFGWGSYFLRSTSASSVMRAAVLGTVAAAIAVAAASGFDRNLGRKYDKDNIKALDNMKSFLAQSVSSISTINVALIRDQTLEMFDSVGMYFSPTMFSPPRSTALIMSCFKMMPTSISLAAIVTQMLLNLSSRSVLVIGAFCMFVQLPMCLKELLVTARFIRKQLRQDTDDRDGMSVLLHDSPKALNLWNVFWNVENDVANNGNTRSEAFMKAMTGQSGSFKEILFPNEEKIQSAKAFNKRIAAALVFSIIIDLLGVATFAVPVLGEAVDIIWAPISSFLVQALYKNSIISTINFLEEILPFMDIIPTATLGFIYTYREEIPVWAIRTSRSVRTNLHELFTPPEHES